MTTPTQTIQADQALKAKHRAMWALGDYPALATDVITDLGKVLVHACGVRRGDRVLDVAPGSGTAAIPAAQAGANVVACDLTPELLEAGRAQAARLGAELQWRQADAEALPFPDGEFDTVMSCVGVMFAPHHQASGGELVRVCRPGGTIGLLSWTPEGFIGQMFATMKPLPPPPPPRHAAAPAVGQRGPRPLAARQRGNRRDGTTENTQGQPLHPPRRLPRLLQDPLRTDHRRLPGHRPRPRTDRSPRPRSRCPRPPPRPRHHHDSHGLGVPAAHRPQATLTTPGRPPTAAHRTPPGPEHAQARPPDQRHQVARSSVSRQPAESHTSRCSSATWTGHRSWRTAQTGDALGMG